MVDKRKLDDVIFHEDHVQRRDMPHAPGMRLVKFTIRPESDGEGFLLESDVIDKAGFHYGTIKLASEYPEWYANDKGVHVALEVFAVDGKLIETKGYSPVLS